MRSVLGRKARMTLALATSVCLLTGGSFALSSPASSAPVGTAGKFVPVQPARVLDTRSGLGAPQAKVARRGSVQLAVLGRNGVPTTGVSAVVLNVTVTATSGPGFVQVFPTGQSSPGAFSNINHTGVDSTIAGLVTAPLGTDGTVTIYTEGGSHLIADVFGYYTGAEQSSDGRYVALSPERILDTRESVTPAPTPSTSPSPSVSPSASASPSPTASASPSISPTPSTSPSATVTPSPSPTTASPSPTATRPPNPGDTKNCSDFSRQSSAQAYYDYYYPYYGDVARLDSDGDGIACESLPKLRASSKVGPGGSVTLQVTGRGGVPASGVTAVALNITATQATAPGFVQVIPTGGSTAIGSSSNLNVTAAGQTIANLVIVPVGTGGRVTLYSEKGSHLLADVAGYYTDASAASTSTGLFQALEPGRLLDTRTSGPKPGDDSTRPLRPLGAQGVPAGGVSGVVLNVTAVGTTAPGFVQAFPTGRASAGTSSNVNISAKGQVIANSALTALGDGGAVSLYVSKSTHLVVDVFGYFLGTGAVATPPSPSPTATPSPTASPSGSPAPGAGPAALQSLTVAPQNTTVVYSRDSWQHWVDDDSDCQDTRAEVLIIETLSAVSPAGGCTVSSGQWFDPYTGTTWTLASDVDIDHFVPLQNAHLSGGYAWDSAKKRSYANFLADPAHLIAVEDNVNQAKGASGPEEWKPPRAAYWCTYATDWAEVKTRWELTVTQAEYDALAQMLATC